MPEVKEPACSPTPPTRPAAGAAGAPADPGGNQIPGGPPIHVFPPGPTDVTLPFSGGTLQGLDVEASVITDYRDVTALAYHAGTATGSKRYNLSPAGVAGGGCQLTADVRKGYRVLGGAWAGPDPARPCSSAVAGGDGTRRDLVFRSRARSSRQHLLTAAGEQPVRLAIGATAAARPGPRGLHPRPPEGHGVASGSAGCSLCWVLDPVRARYRSSNPGANLSPTSVPTVLARQADRQPEAGNLGALVLNAGVVGVQLGLEVVEAVAVVLAGPGVVAPVGVLLTGEGPGTGDWTGKPGTMGAGPRYGRTPGP
jgi:hypothetical protein